MGLSPFKRALLRRLEDLEGTDSLMEFVARCGVGFTEGKGTLRPYHLRPLAELFLEAEMKGGVRACTSVPPQHGKTWSILHWMVRYFQRNPRRNLAYVTFSHAAVKEKARDARRIADAAGLQLSLDNVTDWRSPQGGVFTFTSKGGKLLGMKEDLVVVDDPHRGLESAMSRNETEADLNWLLGTVLSRLTDPYGSVIVNGARWCANDLIGRLLDAGGWRHVNIRAIVDEGRPTERALWPEVKSLEWLKEQRRQLDSRNRLIWPANYEGSPVVEGGQVFMEPAYYDRPFDFSAGPCRVAIGVDVATSPGRGDHSSVFVLAARGHGLDQKAFILDYWTGQVSLERLAHEVARLQKRWSCPATVETNGVGAGLPALIRSVDPAAKVFEKHSHSSKYLRAQPAAAAWNGGRLLLRKDAEYVPGLVSRVRAFTGVDGERDDDVDALGVAYAAVDRPLQNVDTGGKVVRIHGLA